MDQLFTKLERVTALSDDDRSGLLALFSDTHHFKKGGNILREGEQPEHLHVLIDGWAAQCVALVDGSRQTTAFLMPSKALGSWRSRSNAGDNRHCKARTSDSPTA
jgi:CRP-like cAMP-binding protein